MWSLSAHQDCCPKVSYYVYIYIAVHNSKPSSSNGWLRMNRGKKKLMEISCATCMDPFKPKVCDVFLSKNDT